MGEEWARLAIPGDLHIIAQLTSLATDLYPVLQVLLKVAAVKDAIAGGFRVVDHEFMFRGWAFRRGDLGLGKRERRRTQSEPTEKITQQSGTRELTIVVSVRTGLEIPG
jgi:hypothetical protein